MENKLIMTLSKETLQKFIANYPTPFSPLTEHQGVNLNESR
jgi:hypothetical protein